MLVFGVPVTLASPSVDNSLETKEQVSAYIALEASKLTVDASTVERVIKCESNFNPRAIGDHGLAHGRAQFHEETFYRMQKKSGINPDATWDDERTQIKLLIWALKNGSGGEWTCF